MNKFAKLSLVAMMAATTLAGCGSKDDGDSKKKDCPVKIGFVTDTGGIDDHSFNEGSWKGIEKFAKDNNISTDCIKYLQSKGDADYEPNLNQLSEDGYDLVVAAGYKFNDAMANVSKANPDTKFLVIDTVIDSENVQSATFKAEESSYLAGVAAAMQAKAEGGNAVGFIGGEDVDLIRAFQAGFEQGVKSVDKNIKIYVDYAGGYDKTEKGTSLAEKHYSAGAKVIYHAAGGTGNGVFAAAKDRAKKGENVWVIGVDSDQFSTGIYDKKENKSVTLTSALKRVDAVTAAVSNSVLDNKFKAGLQTYDSSNDGVGLPDENPNLSDDIKKAVEDASAKIKSGEIKVSAERTIAPGSNG
mgnify:FL=1